MFNLGKIVLVQSPLQSVLMILVYGANILSLCLNVWKHVITSALSHFYSASAFLATQTAVIARAILSVRPFVCPSRSVVLSI